jgi:hypothetical protein
MQDRTLPGALGTESLLSFVGAIDTPLKQWLATNAHRWEGRSVFCGCSGNFSIEGVVAGKAKAIYSNDISLYSAVLGENLVGRRAEVEIREEAYQWLAPYWKESQAATMIVLFEALKFERQQNYFNQRFWRAWMSRFPQKFELAKARVAEVKERLKLTEFTQLDIGVFLDRARKVDQHGVMISFLPTYANGYEKMYARLNEIFAWEQPPYVMIDEQRKCELFDAITSNWDYVLYDDQFHEGLPSVMLRDKGGARRVWLYSNLEVTSSAIGLPLHIEPTNYARITEDDVEAITADTPVRFVAVKQNQFDYYRTLWLAKHIVQAPCDLPLFVFVGGKLAGFVGVSRSKYGTFTSGEVFLMTDFCVPVAGSRLSKLILWLTRTKELAELVGERFVMYVRSLSTAVFSDKPISMKYRGVFVLDKRSVNDAGQQVLLYRADAGSFTVREAISQWLKSKERSGARSTS